MDKIKNDDLEKSIDGLFDEIDGLFNSKLTKPKAKFKKHDIKYHAQQFIEAIDKFTPARRAALKKTVETYRQHHPKSTTDERVENMNTNCGREM